jgi:hypothetical protein
MGWRLVNIFVQLLTQMLDSATYNPYILLTVFPVLHTLFAQSFVQLPDDQSIFELAIAPFMADPDLAVFSVPFTLLVDCFMQIDARNENCANATVLMSRIVHNWPFRNATKQLVFLSLLPFSVNCMSQTCLEPWIGPMCEILVSSANSLHEQVATLSLSFWCRAEGHFILTEFGTTVTPLLTNVLSRIAAGHWSEQVQARAKAAFMQFHRREVPRIRQLFAPVPHGQPSRADSWAAIRSLAHFCEGDV